MNKTLLATLLVSMGLPLAATAQDRPLVEDLRVGATEAPAQPSFPEAPLPFGQWAGEEFVFLPTVKMYEEEGYPDCRKQGEPKTLHLTYQETVGRVGTVLEVTQPDKYRMVLRLKMNDSGEVIECTASIIGQDISFDGLGLVKDIILAREAWEGNTYYTRMRQYLTYDAATGERGRLDVKKFSPVKVISVSAGFTNIGPVRVVVQTNDGRVGYFEAAYSGTNSSSGYDNTLDTHVQVEDPRKKHKWSKRVWKAIEEWSVFVGMTEAQVKMSLGDPVSVTTRRSKRGEFSIWQYYVGITVTMHDGRVESITTQSE